MTENFWTTVKVSLMVAGAQGGAGHLDATYLRTVNGLSSTSTGDFLICRSWMPGRVFCLGIPLNIVLLMKFPPM